MTPSTRAPRLLEVALPASSVARKAKWKPEGEMEGTKTAAESEAP